MKKIKKYIKNKSKLYMKKICEKTHEKNYEKIKNKNTRRRGRCAASRQALAEKLCRWLRRLRPP